MAGIQVDGANQKLVLDSDGDTYLEAATDDTVKVYVAGAQDFTITANTLTAESGSTIAAQALTATTVTASGIVTGSAFTAGSAVLAEAELELLDGLTAGTAIASKVVTTDANIDTTGQRNLTISGELDAATLDISGNADIDGTTNLDAVDIDGNVQIDATLTVGVNDTGHDVIFYGAAAGAKFFWDESADDLILAKSIFKMDTLTTTGSYAYLYRNDGDLVSTIEDAGDGVGVQLSMYNSDEDFFFRFNNTTPVLTLGASGFIFNEGSNDLDFRVETSGNSYTHMVFVESGAGEFNINESAGDGTITFNQAAEDGNILSFKSSDVAHGTTDYDQTDTFGKIRKNIAGEGGLFMAGYSEGEEGMFLAAFGSTADTAKSISAKAAFEINGQIISGTGVVAGENAFGTNGNIACISMATATEFIFDNEGDFHANSSSTTFDEYDDAQLVRAWDLSHGRGVINSKFDKFVAYNHEKLADLKLVGREEDGTPNHFINVTGIQRLHNGAIWQQYEKHNQLLEAVYDLAKEAVGEDKANAILDKHEVKRLQ